MAGIAWVGHFHHETRTDIERHAGGREGEVPAGVLTRRRRDFRDDVVVRIAEGDGFRRTGGDVDHDALNVDLVRGGFGRSKRGGVRRGGEAEETLDPPGVRTML